VSLVDIIGQANHQKFNFFGYDVMGDLAFGKSFAMLDSGDEHYAVKLLNEGMQTFAFFRKLCLNP
jgi:hypothetical protein